MLALALFLASGFWPLVAATVVTTIADVELTQYCIHAGTCREANPLLLSGRKQAYAIQLPLVVGMSYLGYRWHRDGFKYWWVPQAAVIAGHGIGIGFGLRFVW